jgi:hypothetical protein
MSIQKTASDFLQAMSYANDMVNRDKCQNPNIIDQICSKVCASKPKECEDCKKNIKFKESNKNRIWNDVVKFSDTYCTTDDECKVNNQKCIVDTSNDRATSKRCGFSTTTDYAGHCVITDKTTCDNLNKDYLTCPDSAVNLDDCKASTGLPRQIAWHEDPKEPNKGMCILDNYLLKTWAEIPRTRYKADHSGSVPPPFFYDKSNGNVYITPEYCRHYGMNYGTGSSYEGNELNWFGGTCGPDGQGNWQRSTNCELIGGECKHICVSNKPGTNGVIYCQNDSDCPTSTFKQPKSLTDKGHEQMKTTKCMNIDKNNPNTKICIGDSSDCTNVTGQYWAKLAVGETITDVVEGSPAIGECILKAGKWGVTELSGDNPTQSNVKETYSKDPKECVEDIKNLFSKFNNIDKKLVKFADNKYMRTKKLILKDAAGENINLYLILWDITENPPVSKLDDIGFDYDEVYKKYPEICKIIDGKKFIEINKNQLKNNDLKRIFVYSGSTSWLKSLMRSK